MAALFLASALSAQQYIDPAPAHALLRSPNAKIARTVDAALRRSIPAFNSNLAGLK